MSNNKNCLGLLDMLTSGERELYHNPNNDMKSNRSDLAVVCTVQGELVADVIKSHLESEGIPVLLEYESASRVLGLTVDGLGKVMVLVPQELVEDAKNIIEHRDVDQVE